MYIIYVRLLIRFNFYFKYVFYYICNLLLYFNNFGKTIVYTNI